MKFEGFDKDTLALLPELPSFDEDSYARHRKVLGEQLRKPALALITTVAESLELPLTIDPRGSVSPLHRDLRFAKAGTPRYKDHLLLTTWQGEEKSSSPVLWLRIDATSVGFASGIAFTPDIRDAWRAAIGGKAGEPLAKLLRSLSASQAKHSFEIDGPLLKRVPKPWDQEHPREELLRRTGFQVRFMEALPASAQTARFPQWCAKRLSKLVAVHTWLATELQ